MSFYGTIPIDDDTPLRKSIVETYSSPSYVWFVFTEGVIGRPLSEFPLEPYEVGSSTFHNQCSVCGTSNILVDIVNTEYLSHIPDPISEGIELTSNGTRQRYQLCKSCTMNLNQIAESISERYSEELLANQI